MSFDLGELLAAHQGEAYALHGRYLNPQLARVLTTSGSTAPTSGARAATSIDDQGGRYLDFLSGFGVFALGRSHPVIKDALHQALDADLPNLVQIDCALLPGLLAEALVARAHAGDRAGCSSPTRGPRPSRRPSSSPGTPPARTRILYCDHAFHGLTNGALSLNGGKEFREGFGPLLPRCDQVPFGDIDALGPGAAPGRRGRLRGRAHPGQGGQPGPRGLLAPRPRRCAGGYGTLLVIDEVQTGLGRTGRFFCHEHWGLEPDIITVSKALSGGYVPVGAMLTSARCSTASTARWTGPSSTRRPSRATSWPWWPAWPPSRCFDDEDIVEPGRAHGRPSEGASRPWSSGTSSSTRSGARA